MVFPILFGQYRKDPISMALGGCSSTMLGGIYTVDNNPANLAYHVGREWSLIGGNFGLTNNVLSISEYNKFNGADLEKGGAKEDLLELFELDGWRVFTDFTLTPPFNYVRNNFAFTSTLIGIGQIKVPHSMFQLMFEGNALEEEYDLDFKEQALIANEFAFSMGMPLRKFNVGVSLKYIYGFYYLNLETEESSFITDETAVKSTALFKLQQALGGSGFAADIGFTTYEVDGWRVACSINNIFGSIEWKEEPSKLSTILSDFYPDAFPYDAQTVIRNYVLDIDSLNAHRFATLPIDSVILGYNEDVDVFRKFSTNYPMFVRLGFSKDYPRVATFFTDFTASFSDELFGVNRWAVCGGVEIDKMRFLPIRFGLQLGGRDKIAYSTGIGYNTQLLQFDMAIKLNRGFSVNSLKGAEFSFGLLFRPIY